jgi:WD40 repeat protein/serine/threonine protein kinase
MTAGSVANLVDVLRRLHLLQPAREEELTRDVLPHFSDPRQLARELVRRGWLTPWQANEVVLGRASGLLLGSYVLVEKLGEGGMGTVFKARNWKLDRVVALKLIRKERLARADAVQRFRREIRAAAQLDHPNLVHALDADEVGGIHFFVMEFVAGTDLSRWVKQSGVPGVDRACDFIRQAALGLQHAHERGLVHRDLKPGNLLLTADGTVKVLDFGLARLDAEAGQDSASGLTAEGAQMGTADYMAPEQALDAHLVDHRADLYSLGCALYFLLVGKAPFAGGSFAQKVDKHRHDEAVPVERLRPDVPPAVAAVLRRLMAKRPEARVQSAAELVSLLEGISSGTLVDSSTQSSGLGAAMPEPSSSVRRGRLPRLVLSVAGALLLPLLLAPLVWWFWPPAPVATTPTPEDPVEAAWQGLQARHRGQGQDRRAYRADLLAFRREHFGTPQALRAAEALRWLPSPLDNLDPLAIPELDRLADQPAELVAVLGEHRGRQGHYPFAAAVSPDGSTVATGGNDYCVVLWDAKTLRRRATMEHGNVVNALAFSPDGRRIVAGTAGEIHLTLWDVSVEPPRRAAQVSREQSAGTPQAVAFSPDGRTLAASGTGKVIQVWKVEGDSLGEVGRLEGHAGDVVSIAFSPDGATLASGSADNTVRTWDVTRRAQRGSAPAGTRSRVAFLGGDGTRLVSGSPDQVMRLWHVAPDALRPLQQAKITFGSGFQCLAVGADGKSVAVGLGDGKFGVWQVAEDRWGEAAAVVAHAKPISAVALFPDGQSLVTAGSDWTVRLWRRQDGAWRETFSMKGHLNSVSGLAFSPDGTTLVSTAYDATLRFWDLTATPATERRIDLGWDGPVFALAMSPDGKTVVVGGKTFLSFHDGTGGQRIIQAPVGSQVTSLAFTPDGHGLLVGDAEGGLTLWDTDQQKPLRRVKGHDGQVGHASLSPDGRWAVSVGYQDHKVRLWDVAGGRLLGMLAEQSPYGAGTAWSPDSKIALACGTDRYVRRCKIDGEGRVDPQPAMDVVVTGVTGLATSPDGRWLVVDMADRAVVWRDAGTGQPSRKWTLPRGARNRIAFSPDGRHVAVGLFMGPVYVLRVP